MQPVICETNTWETSRFKLSERYDAWSDILNGTYGSWSVTPSRANEFAAKVRSNRFGQIQLVECICDPCAADRTQSDIVKDEAEFLAIQLVLDGVEHIRLGDQDFVLRAGDIIAWDSTQRMTFDVRERLHKISALLPLKRLREWLPTTWRSMPRRFLSSQPNGFMLSSYLRSLASEQVTGIEMNADALTEAAVAMLVSPVTAASTSAHESSVRGNQLTHVKSYIDRNLSNADLTLALVAQANGISLRYLHWLFNGSGASATQYIVSRRLDRCRRDLANPAMANRTVTEIAFAWGFADAAHFSKRFRQAYSMSPSEHRAKRNIRTR